jgi:hypothetical protein
MEEVFELEFASSDDDNVDGAAPLHKLDATAPATRLFAPETRRVSQRLGHRIGKYCS